MNPLRCRYCHATKDPDTGELKCKDCGTPWQYQRDPAGRRMRNTERPDCTCSHAEQQQGQ